MAPMVALKCATLTEEALMAHKEQRNNREKKKPKQAKDKKNNQNAASIFSQPKPKPAMPVQPQTAKPGS